MRCLVDTHVLLWFLMAPERIPPRIMSAIEEAEAAYASSVTFWEISLKFSLGKLTLEGVTPDELPDYTERAGLRIREASTGLFATFHRLPQLGHRDPFDRLLIHCAIQEHLTLLSVDSAFADYRPYGLKLIDD